jgi:hypothetical protein
MRAAGFVSETVCVLGYAACRDNRGAVDFRVLRMFVINGLLSIGETAYGGVSGPRKRARRVAAQMAVIPSSDSRREMGRTQHQPGAILIGRIGRSKALAPASFS